MTRERRAAQRLLERTGFEPPVPIEDLARQFADVELDRIPGGCDGLIVGVNGRLIERPLILVSAYAPPRRRRFTLAHELGHLMLPWHAGSTLTCSPSRSGLRGEGWEPEANRFAAELLLPTTWLERCIERAASVPELLREVEGANASAQATLIALSRLLPPGHVWAIVDENQVVTASGSSPKSSAEPLRIGEDPDFDRLARFASRVHVELLADQAVMWWEYEHRAIPQAVGLDAASLLSALLTRYISDNAKRRTAAQRISGIAGAAKNQADDPSDPAQIHTRLRRAFTKRREFLPSDLLDDPQFHEWLLARAHELASR